MGRTACTEPQCLYKGALYLYTFGHERVELYLYSPYGPYGLYRASLPVQGCTLPFFTFQIMEVNYKIVMTHLLFQLRSKFSSKQPVNGHCSLCCSLQITHHVPHTYTATGISSSYSTTALLVWPWLPFMVSEQFNFSGVGLLAPCPPQLSWRTDDFLSGLSPLADQSQF